MIETRTSTGALRLPTDAELGGCDAAERARWSGYISAFNAKQAIDRQVAATTAELADRHRRRAAAVATALKLSPSNEAERIRHQREAVDTWARDAARERGA
jgi:hypothetical protein